MEILFIEERKEEYNTAMTEIIAFLQSADATDKGTEPGYDVPKGIMMKIMDNSRNGTGENQADNQTGGGPRRNTRHSINDNGGNGNGSRPPAAFEDTTNIMLPNNPENIGNGDYIESDINHENSYTPETNQSPSEAYRENDWKPF